ncbi:response regulator transcription factor [Myxococcus sp. MISCRS1]|jgi:CheY-like chemotaxis protein|uniref:response regulator n=1 Tax=Myxococcus TaxID=32 RepID=UPI001CBF86D0|nr:MULTISPECIES: response regulator transcription factor [unclassified Myxococcus]MCY0999617.1 response regulator transcription factor [Myxococcus sp. MISCRS1]BDT38772.1 response regulator transcription factor [Myxococcus sp. MH1]
MLRAMSSAAKHRTVLVVEDEDDIRAAIAEILEGEGYDVTVACNGREAMEELTDVRYVPSLILLDLMMPEMNGHEFLERRKAIARLRNVPVMVLTAVTTDIPPGANSLLRKPFSVEELLDAVRSMLPIAA